MGKQKISTISGRRNMNTHIDVTQEGALEASVHSHKKQPVRHNPCLVRLQ